MFACHDGHPRDCEETAAGAGYHYPPTKIVLATAAGGRRAPGLCRDDRSSKHQEKEERTVHCRQGEEEDANQKYKIQIVKFFVTKMGGGEVTRPQEIRRWCPGVGKYQPGPSKLGCRCQCGQ